MTKKIKPGQFYGHNGNLYRAKQRVNGCEGCALNSVYICPNIWFANMSTDKVPCRECNVIFTEPW